VTRLVDDRLEREGLVSLLEARERGEVPVDPALLDRLQQADILALGAAADRARRRECSDEVHVYVPFAPAAEGLLLLGQSEEGRGAVLLRKIALLRLTGALGTRIVVDFGALGLQIAQVALSFGATDLTGPMASRRGLPMVDADERKKMVKRREMAGYVERAGFRAVFVNTEDAGAADTDAHRATRTHAQS
jgi:hypothetical protein